LTPGTNEALEIERHNFKITANSKCIVVPKANRSIQHWRFVLLGDKALLVSRTENYIVNSNLGNQVGVDPIKGGILEVTENRENQICIRFEDGSFLARSGDKVLSSASPYYWQVGIQQC
jgi:hypothetical protein